MADNTRRPRGRVYATKGRFDKAALKRLFGYLLKYKYRLLIVTLCIIMSSIVSVVSQLFLKKLIDDIIVPLVGETNPLYTPLINFIITLKKYNM